MRFNFVAPALALVPGLALAAPSSHLQNKRSTVVKEGIKYNVFEHAATGAKLEFVNNSGICETTPGVNQYSGYLSVGENMNMWFWFFEARNSPSTAPLSAWYVVPRRSRNTRYTHGIDPGSTAVLAAVA